MSLREQSKTNALPLLTQRDYQDPPAFPDRPSPEAMVRFSRDFAAWWQKTKRNIVDLEADVLNLKRQ